jgi:hypothetical protein
VNGRLLDSKSPARSLKVLCGWSVVKAKTGVPKGVLGTGRFAPPAPGQREIERNSMFVQLGVI